MLTFFLSALTTVPAGLVTGWVAAGFAGWAMKRDDYTRHAPPPLLALPPVQATTERLERLPQAPAVVHVHIGGELLPGLHHGRDYPAAPRVIDAQIVRELPE
jgi:hypothetical protein